MSDDRVRVRRARIEEIRPLAERYAGEIAGAGDRDLPMPPGGIFWVADVRGESVGYAAASLRPTGCVVGPIYTDPSSRRAGVGRELLGSIHRWAEGSRVPIVEISVAADNEAGMAFLQSLGYVPRRTLMSLTPTGQD